MKRSEGRSPRRGGGGGGYTVSRFHGVTALKTESKNRHQGKKNAVKHDKLLLLIATWKIAAVKHDKLLLLIATWKNA